MSEKRNVWAEKRGNRYMGRYRDEAGKTKSVGTYDTREQALEAAGRRIGLGEAGDYLGLTLAEYLLIWRDSHLGEEKVTPQVKYSHWMTLNKFVVPSYGRRKIQEFETNPWLSHKLVTSVLSHPKAKRSSQQRVRIALGSAFRPLVKMQLLRINPMAGVEYKRSPRAKQPIFKPDEFHAIVAALPLDAQKACLRFMVYSAMRPGEVFALRVSDIRYRPNGMAVIEQQRKIVMGVRPDEPEAIEQIGSKTGSGHRVKLSPKQSVVLREHIAAEGLSGDDLVFPRSLIAPPKPRPRMELDYDPEADYGMYVNGNKRSPHGRATAYTYGCRCSYCRAAMAVVRRASRDRGKSRAKPSKKVKSADDFMTSRRWYKIFVDAVEAAGIEWEGKAYTTRAAAATWMFKAGAALPDVQEALNHSNPATTLIYLRAAKAEEDETVNSALDSIV